MARIGVRVSTDDGWLDADEQAAWRGWLDTYRLLIPVLDRQLQVSKVSFTEYEVLVCLSESTELRLRMSEVADRTLATRSAITRTVDRLVARGWVRRVKSLQDQRGAYAPAHRVGRSGARRARAGARQGRPGQPDRPADPRRVGCAALYRRKGEASALRGATAGARGSRSRDRILRTIADGSTRGLVPVELGPRPARQALTRASDREPVRPGPTRHLTPPEQSGVGRVAADTTERGRRGTTGPDR